MRTNWPTVALKPERKALKGYIERPGKRLFQETLVSRAGKSIQRFPVGSLLSQSPVGTPHPPEEEEEKKEREGDVR